ncbi:MAG: DUF4197 domain-containing protein [Bacteroidales bacterium]
MKKIFFTIIIAAAMLAGCEWLENNLPEGLTDGEIIEGLKTALNVGTDSSATKLSMNNGYYGNALVKIPLPDEALKVQGEINAILKLAPSLGSYLNLNTHFENVVKSINRAAEEASKEAAPIFKSAINDLSITQGLQILQGEVPGGKKQTSAFDSTAATNYLKLKTYSPLTGLYAPKIDNNLNKNLGLGFSANQAWSTLRTTYNNAVSTIKGNLITNAALSLTGYDLDPLQTESIGVFATEKALNGLFLKVGEEEVKIRRDPWKWVTTAVGDILTKVFGS